MYFLAKNYLKKGGNDKITRKSLKNRGKKGN